jgi:5'-nucleotidase / UDP-sugar diphosphatase
MTPVRRAARRLVVAVTMLAACILLVPALALAQSTKVTLLLTGDIYKMNEQGGRGGYPRLGAVVKAERAANANTVFVHAGDALSPCLLCGFDQGQHVINLTNRISPDIFVPGNHEYDFGRDTYLKRMSEATFPIIAANLRAADGSVLPKHADTRIMAFGDIKIGFIGATEEDSHSRSNPQDLKITRIMPTVAAKAKELRASGADLVVAVIHAGREIDLAVYDSRLVDIVLSGHDHDLRMMYDGRTAMAESGQDAMYVVALDLTIDAKVTDGARSVSWRPQFRMLDTATFTPDPDVLAAVKGYEAELTKELDVPLATLAAPLDSRNATIRTSEAAIANFIADAARAATSADIAVINGGGIRGGKLYPSGHVLTRRDVITELPFGNLNLVFELKGVDVRRIAEIGVSKAPTAAGSFMHYSGMTVEADLTKPVGARVTAIKVGGEPLSDTRTYKVAGSDFFQRGGDGYVMFQSAKLNTRVEDAQLLANDVMVHARKLQSIDLKPEGRIVLKQ